MHRWSRDYDRASDILAGRALRREVGCRFAMASAASEFDHRWRVAVRFAALSRRFNSGSALCGKTTRDYTFITANFLSPPPALYRLWRRLNCFWLIKAPKCHPTASKPGANRLEAPVNIPNSHLCRTPDAHSVQAAVSLRVQRRSHELCVLSEFTQV
jgi:hypothetical protein